MPYKKVRRASVVIAPESSDDEVEHKTDDEMSLVPEVGRIATAKVNPSPVHTYLVDDSSVTIPPADTDKGADFLVTNWLVGEGEG
jgi:hypothetical protein